MISRAALQAEIERAVFPATQHGMEHHLTACTPADSHASAVPSISLQASASRACSFVSATMHGRRLSLRALKRAFLSDGGNC